MIRDDLDLFAFMVLGLFLALYGCLLWINYPPRRFR